MELGCCFWGDEKRSRKDTKRLRTSRWKKNKGSTQMSTRFCMQADILVMSQLRCASCSISPCWGIMYAFFPWLNECMCSCVFRVCVSESSCGSARVCHILSEHVWLTKDPFTTFLVRLCAFIRRFYFLQTIFFSESGEIENDGSRNRRFLVCGCRLARVPIPLGST